MLVFVCVFVNVSHCCAVPLAPNVLALGEEADFEALYCQPSTKADARQNVQLTTEPAFLPNACYL